MALPDWVDWSNTAAGGVGLLLTIAAIVQATGAKRAAKDARQAVYRRNALDDVKRLERLAFNLLTAIETQQYGLASYQARDFISNCLNVREHHRARLGTNGVKLDMAFDLFCAISKELQAGRNKTILIESVQRVFGEMSSLVGVLSRNREEEGQ